MQPRPGCGLESFAMVGAVPVTPPPHAEILALARKTPFSRGAVGDLAKKIPAELAASLAVEALDSAGAPAALVLAFVAAAGGAKLDRAVTWQLCSEVLSLDQIGPLVHAAKEGPLAALVDFLFAKTGDTELECLALLLASDLVGDGAIPPTLLTRGRWLARHNLEAESSIYLGGAAMRLKDRGLSSLSNPHVNRAKRNKKVIEDALATSRLRPLDVLPEIEGTRLSSGFTVKHSAPAVGRNDVCPCGSGKKYKKCHALETAPAAESEPPKVDASAVGPDQVALMRPSEIGALETQRLSMKAFTEAFHRVLDFNRLDLAHRMIGEAERRKELHASIPKFLILALEVAYDLRDVDQASLFFALLPEEMRADEALSIEVLKEPPELLHRLEQAAHRALEDEKDGHRGVMLAATLLRFFPALGIYVARGALHEGRTRDSRALLQTIEDVRDRVLLPPFEMWWDVFDSFFEAAEETRDQKKDDAKREKMKADLRLAKAASRKTATELEKLQRRVAELDDIVPSVRSSKETKEAKAEAPSPELSEERRRLKGKIDELQRIIGEGQEERRDLRRQLADRDEDEPAVSATAPKKEPEIDDESMLDGADVDLPRQILIPRYSDRASKVVLDLAADAAEGVLSTVAALAAGKPNAWGGVKKLAKVKGFFSARAGIHHRVLFAIEDRTLDVLEVLHRKDLEQVVTRLARIG